MDGNGRWAKKRGLPRLAGHKKGVETGINIVKAAASRGVKVLTLYAFSTENWSRPREEVNGLFKLIGKFFSSEIDELRKSNIKVKMIGDKSRLPEAVVKIIEDAETLTSDNTKLTALIAVNYGGRWDVAQAARKLVCDVTSGKLALDEVDETSIDQRVVTSAYKDPDLFIRTGGEVRLSNFLLWQLAYTELYFCNTLWPDFTSDDLDKALKAFESRKRKFGNVK